MRKGFMSPNSYKIISLTEDNIDKEHICCGFSDITLAKGTRLKKEFIKIVRAKRD
jgi:hypothetical protein